MGRVDVEDVKDDVEYDVDSRDGESKRSRKGVRRSLKTQRDHVEIRRWTQRSKTKATTNMKDSTMSSGMISYTNSYCYWVLRSVTLVKRPARLTVAHSKETLFGKVAGEASSISPVVPRSAEHPTFQHFHPFKSFSEELRLDERRSFRNPISRCAMSFGSLSL